jgi:hypothetical protein
MGRLESLDPRGNKQVWLRKGDHPFCNYRPGDVNKQSPEMIKIADKKAGEESERRIGECCKGSR